MFCRIAPPFLILSLVQSAVAANGIWSNPGNASWSAAANWTGAVIASGTDASANFSNQNLPANATVTLDGARVAGSLRFGDSTPDHDWFLRGGTGGSLTLDVAAGSPQVTVINRTATLGVELKGTRGLTKDGPGTLVLAAANTYSGATLVNQGTLRLGLPAAFPSGLQIMPIGDSITYGHDGSNAGYRGPFYQLLSPSAANFRFIGTSIERPGQLPASPVDQRHNEGHSSYTILDTSNNLDGFDNARFLQYGGAERNPNGGYWLTGGHGTGRGPMEPNIITLMIGTNDLPNPSGVENRLYDLISKITSTLPDTRLFVAKITPNVVFAPEAASYNTILENLVAYFQQYGKHVFLVDMNSGFPAGGLTPDGVHPNDTGFNWMARQWYEALVSAYTPGSGPTPAIPSNSPVTIAQGATLHLNGNQAVTGTVTNSGTLDLGNGGTLSTFTVRNLTTGEIHGSGTINGTVNHTGTGIGSPGESITFAGIFVNNGSINTTTGASLYFSGGVVNNGTLVIGPNQAAHFSNDVTNYGTIRVVGGASLQGSATLTNNGLLDLITGAKGLSVNLVNHGVILDSSLVKTKSALLAGNTMTLTIDGYTGHTYQLQHSESLAENGWVDIGAPVNGITGNVLTFTATRDPGKNCGFYRILVAP